MSIFTGSRLTQQQLHQDIDGLRRGYYSDKYFENVVRVLEGLAVEHYHYKGSNPRPLPPDLDPAIDVGNLIVEAQVFNRRAPQVLVGGVDAALSMLRHATGVWEAEQFTPTWQHLMVDAVEDGSFTHYSGAPSHVEPVIKIRGRYRDFALLETPILGILTRISRIATNVYEVLQAANGKPVLFFPARFDLPQVQQVDGYAYWLAVQRYQHDTGKPLTPSVSTDAQGAWWNGHGGGTVPHALIACFLGDSAESMVAFARHIPITTPRILLADFNNDTVTASQQTLTAYWQYYREALIARNEIDQKRWTLNGVRLDTAGNMLDVAMLPDGEHGVSPALVRAVRAGIDSACEAWNETDAMLEAARNYCRQVKIVVTGGFNRAKIERFEREVVPADIYGVGSTFLRNDSETNTDFTMDIVRIQINGQWVDLAKTGRQAGDNPALQRINLTDL